MKKSRLGFCRKTQNSEVFLKRICEQNCKSTFFHVFLCFFPIFLSVNHKKFGKNMKKSRFTRLFKQKILIHGELKHSYHIVIHGDCGVFVVFFKQKILIHGELKHSYQTSQTLSLTVVVELSLFFLNKKFLNKKFFYRNTTH